ncbi:MAG: carboxypeptidase-like regulatory domain-containing protein [Saprospiraceae bacterium]|nr:carboxypeptidase-like regulatory domain-containing protein [Saprospiraceae bacterium]
MKRNSTFIFLLIPLFLSAQTQRIRGLAIDKTTRQPLSGVTVQVADVQPMLGAITDAAGGFAIEKVPLGRARLRCTYLGYTTLETEALLITSVRETFYQVEMQESGVVAGEAVITATQFSAEPLNPLSVVSARSFSVEETERLPASVNDPGRMALSFPGCSGGVMKTKTTSSCEAIAPRVFFGAWKASMCPIPTILPAQVRAAAALPCSAPRCWAAPILAPAPLPPNMAMH